MKERPIIYTAENVKAILEDRKTQTRRIVKPQPAGAWAAPGKTACRYGQPGDRLWVRETWIKGDAIDADFNWQHDEDGNGTTKIWYRADGDLNKWLGEDGESWRTVPWKSPIFMPHAASRLTLEITGVRVERLQDITEEDAKAEGIQGKTVPTDHGEKFLYFGHYCIGNETARRAFVDAWDDMHNPKGYCAEDNPKGWDANPWVWVVEFRRVKA